jgi:hypothetical protein
MLEFYDDPDEVRLQHWRPLARPFHVEVGAEITEKGPGASGRP